MKKVLFILLSGLLFFQANAQKGVKIRLKNSSDSDTIWLRIPCLGDSLTRLEPKEISGTYLIDSFPKCFNFVLDQGRETWFNRDDSSKGYLKTGEWTVVFVYNPRNRNWRYTMWPYNADIDK